MKKSTLMLFSILISLFTISPFVHNQTTNAQLGDIVPPPPSPLLDAHDDTATTNEDNSVTINVLSNDSYSGIGQLTVQSVTKPSNGVATINADNTITYTPKANFFGSDSFKYTVSDSTGLVTDTATVSITVTPVNDVPVATNDSITTPEDTPATINVIANDSDVDGDTLTVTSTSAPSSGTAIINADKTIRYTPNPNFFGSDSFTYTVSDGKGGTATASVSITVTSVNDAPVAVDDSYSTNEDTILDVVAPGVLGNDIDVDSASLNAVLVNSTTSGTLTLNSNGSFTYKPNLNFFGTDSFTYNANDGLASSNTVTVTMTVNTLNDAPVANDDTVAATNEDTAMTMSFATLLANDTDVDLATGDTLTITTVAAGIGGTPSLGGGSITFTPAANFNGDATFTYTLSDASSATDTAIVTLPVTPVNDVPVATNDSITTPEDTPATINVIANDSDVDGDTLTVTSTSAPSSGTAIINADKTIRYTPNPNFFGSDSFTYTVSDGKGGTATASVSITVTSSPVNFVLEKIISGLVAFDPLNNVTMTREQLQNDKRYWTYKGSAVDAFEPDAPHDFFQNSTGRYVGVQTPSNGTYAGFYSLTPSTDAQLFHAVITTPMRTIPDRFFQNGLYIQTDNGLINYVTCVSDTGAIGTRWHLTRTLGNFTHATEFEVLWSDTGTNQPLTRDCTMVTNGDNYLKLYMDGIKVYENNTLDLQMPPPFWYFLEPQNSYAAMFYGIYKDYYATKNEMLTITNLPDSASKVQLIDQNGAIIAEAIVNATAKSAKMDIGAFHFPITANLRVVDSNLKEIIATQNLQKIYGGDIYAITYPAVWTPKIGTTWNMQLQDPVDQSFEVEMYDIDLFDNNKSIVDSLHAKGSKAVCYISAGTWESWRPDADRFPSEVIGKDYPDFPGEKWLDIRQIDVIGPIMQDRLDLCKQKGFDGVEADVVDAYEGDTGFTITYEDQLRYNRWFADEAHKRDLSIGLKNDLSQVNDLVTNFDFAINEHCHKFMECDFLKPFINFGKPVFHIEYVESGQTVDEFCPDSLRNKFSGILKTRNLTAWHEPCKIANPTSVLRILTELTNGTSITGYFVTIKHGGLTKTGFSPASFDVPSGQFITVGVADFGNLIFDHWKDNNMTSSTRNVWLMKDSDFTAVFRDVNSNSTSINP